jgi:hypothetical protein
MTIISGVGRPTVAASAARGGSRSAAFAMASSQVDSSSAASSAVAASPVALDAMLALQEAGSQTVQDRQARRHGFAILQALAALQRELLDGDNDAAAIEQLSVLATSCPVATSASLASTIQAVVLRARVELARRGR